MSNRICHRCSITVLSKWDIAGMASVPRGVFAFPISKTSGSLAVSIVSSTSPGENMRAIVCVSVVLFLDLALAIRTSTNQKYMFESGSCRTLRKEINNNIRSSSCKPRETSVEIHSDSPEIIILPNKIPVKKCDGGSCTGQYSCLPVKTEEVQFAVRQRNFFTKRETCGVIKIVQHSSCKCGCSVMEHHCNEKQEYRPAECRCACKNSEEQHKCAAEGKVWDSHKCSCVCSVKYSNCTTGTEWVPNKCKCMKIMSEESDYGYSNFNDVF